MRRAALSLLLWTGIATLVGAGDIGTFVNLGFSADSTMFAFGVYSVASEKSTPHAELYVVDVQKNNFATKGQFEFNGTEKVALGQDGSGSLYKLIGQSQETLTRSKIDHDRTGRLVYLLLNGDEPKDALTFRDFNTGVAYSVSLTQTVNKNTAAFSIAVTTQTTDGKTATYKVGKPTYFRDQVITYKIRQIILAPNEAALVFVIEKVAPPDAAIADSYMIETLPLR